MLTSVASGDPRNVMTTVSTLPADYKCTCTIVINDCESYVTLRNIIMLVMATQLDINEAAEATLHIWYSAALSKSTFNAIKKIGHQIKSGWNILGLQYRKKDTAAFMILGPIYIILLIPCWNSSYSD